MASLAPENQESLLMLFEAVSYRVYRVLTGRMSGQGLTGDHDGLRVASQTVPQ